MTIDLLIEKVYVYSDYIEIILHYTDEPINTLATYSNDESLEGSSLRGSLIYADYIWYDDYFRKKIVETLGRNITKPTKCQ